MATHALAPAPRPANPVASLIAKIEDAFGVPPRPEIVANDNGRSWIADPRAARLLASCADFPPAYVERRARYSNATDRWSAFAGYRVECLDAIRLEIGDRLMRAYHQHGESAYEPFRQWCEQPNASDAVAAALASSTEH